MPYVPNYFLELIQPFIRCLTLMSDLQRTLNRNTNLNKYVRLFYLTETFPEIPFVIISFFALKADDNSI